jgi:hypothetical protein
MPSSNSNASSSNKGNVKSSHDISSPPLVKSRSNRAGTVTDSSAASPVSGSLNIIPKKVSFSPIVISRTPKYVSAPASSFAVMTNPTHDTNMMSPSRPQKSLDSAAATTSIFNINQ